MNREEYTAFVNWIKGQLQITKTTLTFDYYKNIEVYINEATSVEIIEAGFQDICERYNCIVNFNTCTITGKEEDLKKILLKLNQ